MIFGRRYRPGLLGRLRGLLWPKGGLHRTTKYFAHRMSRLPGSPYSIAAGFACGAAVSFTPLIGFHFLLGALLAYVIGGNLIASAIGTAIGNPWTFPFIWSWIYTLGRWLLDFRGQAALPEQLNLNFIFHNPWEVLYPMVVGSLPTAVAAWLIFFWPCYKAVAKYQAARRARRERARVRRQAKRARRGAGAPIEGEGS